MPHHIAVDEDTGIVTFFQEGKPVYRVQLENYSKPLEMPAELTVEMVDSERVQGMAIEFVARDCINIKGKRWK